MILHILICLVLLIILIQDFRFRSVHWVLFPTLFILIVTDSLLIFEIHNYLTSIAINLLVVITQGLLLAAYYKIQGINLKDLFKGKIGLGDILFILIMAFAFSWSTFLFYYIAGLLFTLITWIIIRSVNNLKSQFVPLAGLLALFMTLVMLADIISAEYNRFMDILSIF